MPHRPNHRAYRACLITVYVQVCLIAVYAQSLLHRPNRVLLAYFTWCKAAADLYSDVTFYCERVIAERDRFDA